MFRRLAPAAALVAAAGSLLLSQGGTAYATPAQTSLSPIPPCSRSAPRSSTSRRQADGRRRLRRELHRHRRLARPASGARVLRRPWQEGRDLRLRRRPGLVRRVPGPNTGDGADDARPRRSRCARRRGYDASTANVIVSARTTTPPRRSWASGATRTRRTSTASRTRPSRRSTTQRQRPRRAAVVGHRHRPGLLSQVQGTDQMAGFAIDDNCRCCGPASPAPARRSASTSTCRRTPTSTTRREPGNNQFSADYPGYVRDRLAQLRRHGGHRRGHARPPGVDRRRPTTTRSPSRAAS